MTTTANACEDLWEVIALEDVLPGTIVAMVDEPDKLLVACHLGQTGHFYVLEAIPLVKEGEWKDCVIVGEAGHPVYRASMTTDLGYADDGVDYEDRGFYEAWEVTER